MKATMFGADPKSLSFGANGSGEVLVTDWKDHWWKVPTKFGPVDLEKLQEDCESILSGIRGTSYLLYIGIEDIDFDLGDMLLAGWMPFGSFDRDTSELHINLRLAGPQNLLLFGREDEISELPEAVVRFHSETNRICREFIGKAKRARGNVAWQFHSLVVEMIRYVMYWAFIDEFDDLPDWFNNSTWEVLAQFSGYVYKDNPVLTLPLYLAAYELDGVCLPVPNEIIEDFDNDDGGIVEYSVRQSRALRDAWAKADCQPPALLESLKRVYKDLVNREVK